MKYQFIKAHKIEYTVEEMCQVIGVSRSGYYAWEKRKPSQRKLENRYLSAKIEKIYAIGRQTYGLFTILKKLIADGFKCGKNRVYRLMRKLGISAKNKKKFKVTTNSKHDLPISENIINRDFTAEQPNTKWVGDITYIGTNEGWLYLAIVLDLHSRKIVGWSMDSRMTTDLITKAFLQAVWSRKPDAGLIFHSDRGSQYASKDFRKLLKNHKAISSMSRKGNCWDNAVAESFFHTLKCECVYRTKYKTRQEAKGSIFEYIEVFYNRVRRHSTLGYISPNEFESGNNMRKVA